MLLVTLRNNGLWRKKSLQGKHVVVTGAGSGIGRQMSLMMAKQGAKLSLWDLNLESVQNVQKEIANMNQKAISVQCDVSNKDYVEKAAEQSEKAFGQVNILVNNAGIVSGKKLLELNEGLIRKTIDVNTVALHWTVQRFLPQMVQADNGHIVTIASLAGIFGSPGLTDYNASKFGAVGFDEALRLELKKIKSQVKTTCICPFFINTGMFDGVKIKLGWLTPILQERYAAWRIVTAIRQEESIVLMSYIFQLLWLIKVIAPTSLTDFMVGALGGLNAMDQFKGRN